MSPIFWPIPRVFPTLAGVHVWCGYLDWDQVSPRSCPGLLSPDEEQRANRFKTDRDRYRFIAARTALRRLIAGYLCCAPQSVVFSYNDRGKPFLSDPPGPLTFNLAHTHGLGVWAFRTGGGLGVDVEYTGREVAMDAIARRFFTAREWMALRDLNPEEKRAGFFRCWTQKEAFVKALGRGLGFGLSSFEVAVHGSPQLFRAKGKDATAWKLMELHPAKGYVGALALEGKARVDCFQWEGASGKA